MKRSNLSEELGAALLQILELQDELDRRNGEPVEPIPREVAKALTPSQIRSLFEVDHYPIRREMGGTNHPANLHFRLWKAHRVKTAKRDVPEIRKGERIWRANVEHALAMTDKLCLPSLEEIKAREIRRQKPKHRWPKGRKIANRGFDGNYRPMRQKTHAG